MYITNNICRIQHHRSHNSALCRYLAEQHMPVSVVFIEKLTHCGLVTAYGGRDLGQHWSRLWLVAWRHQAIIWTNVDLWSLRSSDVHLRAISLEISQPSVTKISLKIIFLRFYWNLPGTNELTLRVPFLYILRGRTLSSLCLQMS